MHGPNVMSRIQTYPGVEVRPEVVGLFRAGFDLFPSLAPKYLRKLGLVPEEEGMPPGSLRTVPLDRWLSLFDAVLAEIGPNALFNLGARIIANPHLQRPAQADLESTLRHIDVAFHMSHRKDGQPMFDPGTGAMQEGIGHYRVQQGGSRKTLLIRCDTPYPCALEHGIVSGVAKQVEARAVVVHEHPHRCRSSGSPFCVYAVSW